MIRASEAAHSARPFGYASTAEAVRTQPATVRAVGVEVRRTRRVEVRTSPITPVAGGIEAAASGLAMLGREAILSALTGRLKAHVGPGIWRFCPLSCRPVRSSRSDDGAASVGDVQGDVVTGPPSLGDQVGEAELLFLIIRVQPPGQSGRGQPGFVQSERCASHHPGRTPPRGPREARSRERTARVGVGDTTPDQD